MCRIIHDVTATSEKEKNFDAYPRACVNGDRESRSQVFTTVKVGEGSLGNCIIQASGGGSSWKLYNMFGAGAIENLNFW